jgi:hypothetical protein
MGFNSVFKGLTSPRNSQVVTSRPRTPLMCFFSVFISSMCCVFNLWSRNNVHTRGYNPTFRRNKLPPPSKSTKFMCKKSNCSCCYNSALTKAVLVLANCVGRTEKSARTIRNMVTLTLTNKKWNYCMTEAGLVKPLDL